MFIFLSVVTLLKEVAIQKVAFWDGGQSEHLMKYSKRYLILYFDMWWL